MANNEQRTFIYLNFDIDPFTAELVFPQGVPKGGSVCLVFGALRKGEPINKATKLTEEFALRKGEPINKATKLTEEFAHMVSGKVRVSSPLVEGGPQCFMRISLVKDGAQMPPVPRPNETVSLPKKPVPPPQQQKKVPPHQFPLAVDANVEDENEEDVDGVVGPSGRAGRKARATARSRVLAEPTGQVPAEANGDAEDGSGSEGEASVSSRPSSSFDDFGDGAGAVSDGDELRKKFGAAKNDPPGPNAATTVVGQEIPLQFVSSQERETSPEEDPLAKCRICKENHWTVHCPFKDKMALPEQLKEESKPLALASGSSAAPSKVKGKGKSGKYIPPTMHEGADQCSASMSQSRTRGVAGTIRVTNLSEDVHHSDLRDLFRPFGQLARIYLVKNKVTGQSKVGTGHVHLPLNLSTLAWPLIV
ncbi:hypothetical protein HPB48_023146 [Haemaphysalis longicornis]|uniref:RRM domain-containing protein n=1 Tax=Haemaphysalis longicornis TaxID=44386 RepID=A0A9J6FLZ9_HAELO|nr:hypothetical protein HPB48_023146 [Haemaphysalis longicornis]